MTALLVRAGALLAVYLLVLTSVEPGDVALGGVLAVALSYALRPRHADAPGGSWTTRAAGMAGAVLATAAEVLRGTARTARFCLGSARRSGVVEIPRGDRSRHAVALWGVLTGESPDEVVVDVDPERDVLVVHLVDASDPEGVRARHRREYERRQRRAVS